MPTILHLSDLHFGEQLKAPHDGLLTRKDGAPELAKRIFRQIEKEDRLGHLRPQCMVVTGDCTTKAEPAEFERARVFIVELLGKFSLTVNELMVVPGNHDISWGTEGLENDDRYTSFKHFYKDIFGKDWVPDEPSVLTIQTFGEEEIAVIFGFNSCMVENRIWSGLGYIPPEQFDFIEKWLAEQEKSEVDVSLRLAALHHHVLPVYNYHPSFIEFDPRAECSDSNRPPLSLLMNASQLLKKCRQNSVSAILHGHAHVPYSAVQTNYLHRISTRGEHISRSLAILGAGSPWSDNVKEFPRNQYQIIDFKNGFEVPLIQVWSFLTSPDERNINEMTVEKTRFMPGGREVVDIPPELLSKLRNILNTVLEEEDPRKAEDSRNGSGTYLRQKLYDGVLDGAFKWLNGIGYNYGAATIARYISDLGVYKLIAIKNYSKRVRDIAYSLREPSITVRCALRNKSLLIPKRSDCKYRSISRDKYYRETLGGEDQTCLAVPLNSTGKDYPYAVLSFARPWWSNKDSFSHVERAVVESISDIIENALRKAELAEIAYNRRQLLLLFNWLQKCVKTRVHSDPFDAFNIVARRVYEHLGLNPDHEDALAIFLPEPPKDLNAMCVAECGFGLVKAQNMVYKMGQFEGLTGRVIDTREYDYCMDHLNGNRSMRGQMTSAKCEKSSKPTIDHHLSFVGVPLGNDDPERRYNKGALVLNIATPVGHGHANYMESMYVEPLQIIAQLLDPIIEGPWKEYCQSISKVGQQKPGKKQKTN